MATKSSPQSLVTGSTANPSGSGGFSAPISTPRRTGGGGGSGSPQSAPDNSTVLGGTPPLPTPQQEQPIPVKPKQRQDFGLPTITEQEAARSGQIIGGTTPAFIVKSSTSPSQAIEQSGVVSQIPYTQRTIPTEDLVISNLANVRAGQRIIETQENFQSPATDIIFEQESKAAREQYLNEVPRFQREKLSNLGFIQGVSSTVVSTGEFAATGFAYLTGGLPIYNEKGEVVKSSVEFGGALGEVGNYPIPKGGFFKSSSVIGQAAVIVPTLYLGAEQYLTRIGSVGFGEASAETLSFFSPIRFKAGVYAPNLNSDTTFKNIKSYSFTGENGITTRFYKGNSGTGINLKGYEAFAKSGDYVYGGGLAETSAPVLEVKPSGSVNFGVRKTIQPYAFETPLVSATGSRISGTPNNYYVSPQTTAGISKVLTSKGLTAYQFGNDAVIYNQLRKGSLTLTGGITPEIGGGITGFISGRRAAGYKLTNPKSNFITGEFLNKPIGNVDFLYSPTGRSRVRPQFSGVDINLNEAFSGFNKGVKGTRSFGLGRSGTITRQQLGTTSFTSPSLSAETSLTTSQVQSVFITPNLATTQRLRQTQTPQIRTTQLTGLTQVQSPAVTTIQIPRMRLTQTPFLATTPQQTNIPTQIFKPTLVQTPRLSTPNVPFLTGSPFNFVPNLPKLPSFYFSQNIGRGSFLRGNRGQRYSPSLTASSLNIVGTIPKRFRGGVVDPFSTRVIPLIGGRGKKKKRR